MYCCFLRLWLLVEQRVVGQVGQMAVQRVAERSGEVVEVLVVVVRIVDSTPFWQLRGQYFQCYWPGHLALLVLVGVLEGFLEMEAEEVHVQGLS